MGELRWWGPAVILTAVVSSFLFVRILPQVQRLVPSGMSGHCSGASSEFRLRIRSAILLNHAVLGRFPTSADAERAASEQINFVRGYYMNVPKAAKAGMAFARNAGTIRILAADRGRYGADLVVQRVAGAPQVPPKTIVERAIARGHVDREDSATRFEYEAEIDGVACTGPNHPAVIENLALPLDPYLAYWTVPEQDRRLRSWGESHAVIPPCGTDELADFHSPEYLWYFYDPENPGCRKHMTSGTAVQAQSEFVSWRELPSITHWNTESLSRRPEIEISVVFGYVDDSGHNVPPADLTTALHERRGPTDPRVAHWDSSTRQFLLLWERIESIGPIVERRAEPDGDGTLATLRGVFRGSGKPFRLQAYVGPTDLFSPSGASHWRRALDGMLNADVFIYGGHSGLGENLNVQRLAEQGLSLASVSRRPSYQILAFLSCFSYSYFDPTALPALPWLNARRNVDAILTGGSGLNKGREILEVLSAVSQSLTNRGQVALAQHFRGDTPVISRSYREPAGAMGD